MKRIYLILILITAVYTAKAQNLIAVQHSGSIPAFYTSLDDAVTNAQNGDTIYLPGGAFTFSSGIINKELHIIGVGHNPDSTFATGMTKINVLNNIYLVSGANNSSFDGLYINNGNIYAGTNSSDEDVDNITIIRCHITGNILLSALSTNWVVSNNIIDRDIYGMYHSNNSIYAQSNYISNNIIEACYYFGPNNQFKNNFFFAYYFPLSQFKSCVIENNLFQYSSLNVQSCTLNNNIFMGNYILPSDCIGSNNIINQTQSSIFVNYSGNGFSYTDDYHLKSTCAGKNAGTDGTDIGIYGGAFPWKEGSVPHNPHIINKTIGGTTNSNGALPVNIKVSAQGN